MPWFYAPVEDDLPSQGEQLFRLPLLRVTRDAGGRPIVRQHVTDSIVLTQTCDIEERKVQEVLLAPTHGLDEWLRENPNDWDKLDNIRQGFDVSLYLLPAWQDGTFPRTQRERIVNLGQPRSMPLADLLTQARGGGLERVALTSPLREHFAQAVARSLMRVGLPMEVPPFESRSTGQQRVELADLRDCADLLRGRTYRVIAPISAILITRQRQATGEQVYVLTSERQSVVRGVGFTPEGAEASFSRQLVRRYDDAESRQGRWRWVADFLEIRA